MVAGRDRILIGYGLMGMSAIAVEAFSHREIMVVAEPVNKGHSGPVKNRGKGKVRTNDGFSRR